MSAVVHVLAVGPFGEAVADRLRGDGVLPGPVWPPETWPAAGVRVLAAWRPVPALEAALDEASFRTGTPWLPVVQEHPVVRVGPAVVPGVGPCNSCARLRLLQHDGAAGTSAALLGFYDAHPDAGPAGFLPPAATVAAATASQVVERLAADPGAVAGRTWELDVLTLAVATGRVTGVHGCPRCGAGGAGGLLSDLRQPRPVR